MVFDNLSFIKERFLVLTRSSCGVGHTLLQNISELGETEVIVDGRVLGEDGDELVWIPDGDSHGYEYLMSNPRGFPLITSWSRAFVHLSRTLRDDEAVWFVEDDVAGDAESFRELIEKTAAVGADLSAIEVESAEENPGWIWFPTAEGFFEKPWRSFNPLCRLSARLIRRILEFREEHGRMTFHEVLFASLAKEEGMIILDWQKDIAFKHLVANFRYRPVIRHPVQGVCHPVKDLELLDLLGQAPPPEFPRMGLAKLSGYSINSEDYVFLSRLCREMKLRKVIEFGPGDSTLAFRDADCDVISYEHDREWLGKAEELIGDDPAVSLRFCHRNEAPEDIEAADLVFVDGPPQIAGEEMSRLKVCEWAIENHGVFLLHDANREAEKAILKIFQERGLEILEIPTRKGMALVFEKERHSGFVEIAKESIANWPRGESLAWRILVGNERLAAKVLAIGGTEERGLIPAVRNLLPHPKSSFHQILPPDAETSEKGIEIYEGESVEILSWMIATEGYWESFDLIIIDPEVPPFDFLSRICQAWPLLKPGGLLGIAGFSEEENERSKMIEVILESLGEQTALF